MPRSTECLRECRSTIPEFRKCHKPTKENQLYKIYPFTP